MIKVTNITKWIIPALFVGLSLTSCNKDDIEPEERQFEQAKTIEWEVFHEFEQGEMVTRFEISDDAK